MRDPNKPRVAEQNEVLRHHSLGHSHLSLQATDIPSEIPTSCENANKASTYRASAESSPEIRALLDECSTPEILKCFGLVRPTPTSDYMAYEFSSDRAYLDALEQLCNLLARIMEAVAGNAGM